MFIAWGSGSKIAEVGPVGARHCRHCDRDAPFTGMVEYSFRHVYWVFRWVSDRVPYVICGNCGGVHDPDPDAYDSPEVRRAIPLWDRRGWLIGLGGFAAIIAAGSVAAAADHARDGRSIAAPRAGDRYETDLAQILAHPDAQRMYGILRVTRVDDAGVEVQLSRRYHDDWQGVEHDKREGLANEDAYYAPERARVPRAALQRMFDAGAIRDVQR